MFLFTTINYVHPVLFLISIFKGYSIGTILHDFIIVDIHCESKCQVVEWTQYFTPFFLCALAILLSVFFSYYCLCYCCPILIIVI